MANARDVYNVDANKAGLADPQNKQFDLSFPYLSQSHVSVTVNGTATTAFTYATSTRIQLNTGPTAGDVVVIKRATSPNTRLVDYQTGSVLSDEILDKDSLQAFYLAQEANDLTDVVVSKNASNLFDAGNERITNVADPTDAQDVATKNYLENTWLSISDKQNVNLLGTTENVTNMSTLGATGVVADIAAVAGVASTMAASAQNATDAAAAASAAATSASAAATALDDFDDKYLGVFTFAATPTVDNDGDALETGALFYDSTNAVMKVWDGSSWIAATAPASTSFIEYRFVATAGQTSFTGADANGSTLGFIVNNCSVSLNGVKLSIGTDFTTPSGTVVTLTQAASLNDILVVEAFKSFAVSDAFLKSAGGTINGSLAVDGTITTGSALVKNVGKETIWVPASAMSPSVSQGCAPLATTEILSNRPNILTLDFDTSDIEHAQFSVAFPKSWNKNDVTFQLYWSAQSVSSNGVAFMMQSLALNDTSDIDLIGYGTQGALTDTHSASTSKVNITSESSALSIGTSNNPAPSDSAIVYFQLQRQTYSSNDTLASDVRVHGIKLFFTTNAGDDA